MSRLLVVRQACSERSVFDRLRPSVEGLTTKRSIQVFRTHQTSGYFTTSVTSFEGGLMPQEFLARTRA